MTTRASNNPTETRGRAIVYLRVSTDEQGASGLGLEAQEQAARDAADRLGLDVVGVFTDVASGAASIEKRPGLLGAIDALGRGDVLILAKRDRLARDPLISAMAERLASRKGARVISAAGEGTENDDPASVLMRRLLDSFSEYERLIIGARTKAALAAKRSKGEKTGGRVPFGYQLAADGRTLLVDETETEIIDVMRQLRAEGQSFRKIADELNRRGVTAKGGGEWIHTSVRNIIGREMAA